MTRSFARQASFTWLPPATPNGRIREYGVAYRPLRPVLPCSPIEQTENNLIVPMSSQRVNLEELRPYTVYIISVHAVTVKPGPEFTTNFTTEQAGKWSCPSEIAPSGSQLIHFHLNAKMNCERRGKMRNLINKVNSKRSVRQRMPLLSVQGVRTKHEEATPSSAGRNAASRAASGLLLRYFFFHAAPSEVRQLQMTRSFARQASFTWLPPATPNGRIREYRVVYTPLRLVLSCSPIEQTETKLTVPMSSQRVNLQELHPYTVYIISVHAVTVKPGPEITTNFTTEQAVPEGIPTALNYSKGTGDEYVIFWGPVPCELANGVVRRYYLELDSADPWESRLVNHTTDDMRLGFSDLLPYTRYRAKVYAENDAGRSQVAAELNFTTSPAAPSEVRQLQMTRSFARQASFTWLPPATPNGRIRDYGVAYRPLRLVLPCSPIEQTETKLIVPMSSQRVNLEELHPYTVYMISIHAVTVKPGPEFTTNFTTEQDVPDAPASVRCARREENSLKIQWDEPQRTNGILKHYRVNVSLTHSFSSSVNASTRPRVVVLEDLTTREYNLSDLYPGTTYRVCDVEGPVVPVNFSDAQEMQLGYYMAAMFSPEEVRELSDFVLGAGNVVGGFENPPLTDATPYRIGLLVASNFSDEVRYGYRLSEPVVVRKTDGTSEIRIVLASGLALLVLLALMSAALTCFCIRRRSGPASSRKKGPQDPLSRLSKCWYYII
ncbi:unnamed protein product [Ixodes persulcatus]